MEWISLFIFSFILFLSGYSIGRIKHRKTVIENKLQEWSISVDASSGQFVVYNKLTGQVSFLFDRQIHDIDTVHIRFCPEKQVFEKVSQSKSVRKVLDELGLYQEYLNLIKLMSLKERKVDND